MSSDLIINAFVDEFEKIALGERLVRLMATDIPNTPRFIMKSRSPEELRTMQNFVENWWNKNITQQLMRRAEPGISYLPKRTQPIARKGAELVAEDPIGTVLSNMIPLPGAHPGYVAGKKALERGIDRFFPLPKK